MGRYSARDGHISPSPAVSLADGWSKNAFWRRLLLVIPFIISKLQKPQETPLGRDAVGLHAVHEVLLPVAGRFRFWYSSHFRAASSSWPVIMCA